ncbi:hypothetical protein PL321_01260 [Caloramator sp. mosi_1]|uniref:hypothetical protein n=1 Tax=Caloramator sp. mosi_1 TaxID=3023090 RepID=UPI00235E8FF2|nr:hypothetical protein [Caloramator sp. mosi_1]WDC84462.1 hypothetical protein PL321_01260 [Caloramator sp. mosi_1]
MLIYHFEDNIPLFRCSLCGRCDGFIESKSYINKNRGCCWYYPKYTLMDIKNIISLGREDFIRELSTKENVYKSNYFLEVRGYFDEEGYKKSNLKQDIDFDTKLFFRLCPFWQENGCKIEFKLRPHPCNLYLCREVIELCKDGYSEFSKERRDYFSYMNYFNEVIKHELMEKRMDLTSDFEGTLDFIKNYQVPNFEPRLLRELHFINQAS